MRKWKVRRSAGTGTINLTGTGELRLTIPRKLKSFTVTDLPGLPGGSNFSDPSWVTMTVTQVRRRIVLRNTHVVLTWDVSTPKQAVFTGT